MPGVSVQFHMRPDELLGFVADVVAELRLGIELVQHYPELVTRVPADGDVRALASTMRQVDRVYFLYRPPRCRKHERLNMSVGRLKDTRLEQSDLNGGSDNVHAYQALKKIVSLLKQRTQAGMWVRTEGGHVGYEKIFRYSAGAADAVRAGTLTLTAIGFTQSFFVDPPSA